MYARKKVFDYDLQELGIKEYGEKFTIEQYIEVLRSLNNPDKGWHKGSIEFMNMIKPKYMEQIMNTIAENKDTPKPDKNFYWDGQDLKT